MPKHGKPTKKFPAVYLNAWANWAFCGLMYPEKYGGSEVDFFYTVVFLEEIARSGLGGFAAALGVHVYMSVAHINEIGSEYLKETYLRPAIDGEKVGALAISEPGAGSDVANIRTTAVKDGDEYVINGSKTFITNGVYSDYVVVACKTQADAGLAGISLIVVDRDTPGFSANKLKKMGWDSSDTGELFFDEVRVPTKNLVGNEGEGFYYIMESFQLERLVAAVGSVGAMEYGLELSLQYMSERKAFGRPINKFQAMRHTIADLASEVESVKQFGYYTSWLFDQGEVAVKECSMFKMLTTELGKKAADICMECFGGNGYMEEFPMARMVRDSRAVALAGGTSNIMREIIAKMVIDGVNYKPVYQNSGKKVTLPTENKPSGVTDNGSAAQANGNSNHTKLENNMSETPQTAREILLSLPNRYKSAKKPDYSTLIHFDVSGDNGGQFTVNIDNGVCSVSEGLQGEPKCLVTTNAETYENVELGRDNPQMAVMMGKIRLSNLSEMMTFSGLFERLH